MRQAPALRGVALTKRLHGSVDGGKDAQGSGWLCEPSALESCEGARVGGLRYQHRPDREPGDEIGAQPCPAVPTE